MPTVALEPSALIHSCSLVYLRSDGYGMLRSSWLLAFSSELRAASFEQTFESKSVFLRALVKRCRHNLRSHALTANFNFHARAGLRVRRRHVGQGDVLLQKRRRRTAGDVTNFLARFVEHLIAIAGDAALDHLHSDQCAPQAFGLRSFEGGAADEFGFLHLDEAVETGFPDVDGVGDFVAVEREFGLEAQRVTRSQAARECAEFLAGLENFVPDTRAGGFIGGNVNLKAVFSGIAGARDQDVFEAADRSASDPIEFHGG